MITNKEIAERIRVIADELEQDKSSVITLKYERTYSMMFGYGTRVKADIKTDYGDLRLEFQDIDKKPKVGESSDQPSE